MLSPSANNVLRAETVALDTRGRLASKSRHKAFQDPCHPTQSLYYSPLAVQFIDTPEFQRLRRLKQLGTADTVFPGAVHSRFQHSLGTYFFAKHQMSILRDKQPELRLNSRDVEIVALAGLCHDLGHGPFSHAFETFISNAGVHFEHEEMSAKLVGRIVKSKRLLRTDDELAAWDDVASFEPPPALSARDVLLIRCMIATTERTKHAALVRESLPHAKSFMMDIVCNSRNSIDVDKFDYLIRDAYFCGSSVRPSPHRLMDNCRVIGGVLCYRKKVLHAIYQLFNVRANNFREIYGHRVSKAIEFMIMDALRLVDAKLGISSSAADPAKFIRLDDSIVSVVRFRATEPANVNDADFRAALDLIERIERRDVYKAVFESLFRNERAAKQRIKVSEMVPALVARAEVALGANRVSADDVRIQVLNLNFAMGEKDPLKLVEIYDSEFDTVPRRPTQSDIGHLVPIIHDELLVRVFCTRPHDNEMCVALKRAARDYISSLSLPPTPAATPVKPPFGGHGGRDTTSFAEQPSSANTAGIDPSDDAHAATNASSPLKLGRRKREDVPLDQRAAVALEEDDNIESQQDEADLRILLHQMQTAMGAALRLVDKKNDNNSNSNNNNNNNVTTTDYNNHGDVVQPRQDKKRARRATNETRVRG
jgi:HD superfamily phosphohydrolase